MKRFKSFLVALAFIFAGVLAFSLASNTKVHAETATFDFSGGVHNTDEKTITWSNSVLTIMQEVGTGQSEPSYISAPRWYSGNVVTFTAASNYIITGLTITCNTNNYATTLKNSTWSDGTATVNNTVVTWEGSLDSAFTVVMSGQARISSLNYTYSQIVNPESVYIDETLNLTVGDSSTLTATVLPENATNKKVNWTSLDTSIATVNQNGKVVAVAEGTTTVEATLDYDNTIKASCTVVVSTPSHQEFIDFKQLDLQEQLAFGYHYDDQYEVVTNPVQGKSYYLGSVDEWLFAESKVSNNTLSLSSGLSNASTYSVVLDGDYYLITVAGKYLIINDTSLSSTPVDGATITDYYRWSFDSNSNRLINVGIKTRYLGINDAKTGVKAYATSGSYTPVALIPADGEVTFKDAANNEDRVTMRIGYTISKELYDSLESLGTTVNFGVRLNDTINVECTKVELDENNYRLFVAVNNIPLTSIDIVLTACGYVSVDGTDYYTTDVNEYSVRTLAQKYLTDYATDDAVISAKYALIYLAYYA